jgi:hypothetical protein
VLPPETPGELEWKGQRRELAPGPNTVTF